MKHIKYMSNRQNRNGLSHKLRHKPTLNRKYFYNITRIQMSTYVADIKLDSRKSELDYRTTTSNNYVVTSDCEYRV